MGASASDTISYTAHGFSTGDKVIYTAGGTSLTNLTSGTTYYAIKVDDNNFKLASSSNNASAGTAITVGGAGGSSTDKFTNPLTIEVLKNDYLSFSTPVSIDIDGDSFAAARFSGELQIESSSAISTSNDGGATTVTGTQNSFKDGFYEIVSSSTGEIKTIKPVVLEGDFSAGHFQMVLRLQAQLFPTDYQYQQLALEQLFPEHLIYLNLMALPHQKLQKN